VVTKQFFFKNKFDTSYFAIEQLGLLVIRYATQQSKTRFGSKNRNKSCQRTPVAS